MKYTVKNYFVDVLCFGLSLWIPSILYMLLYACFRGGIEGLSFDIIDFIGCVSFALMLVFPIVFGRIFGQKPSKKSLFGYLTVCAVMIFVMIMWNVTDNGLIAYVFGGLILIPGYFGKFCYIFPFVFALLYFVGAKLKMSKVNI